MRYSKEHKEQVRHKLLAASGGHAKKHGFANSGVDALAAAAGLTIGSLYKHFDTKDALFVELIRHELQRTVALFQGLPAGDGAALVKTVAGYVSTQHVGTPEAGCALPALTAEVARAPDTVRHVFQDELLQLHQALSHLSGSAELAWALIAQCVGAVMLARAMPDEAPRRALLDAVRASSAQLIQATTHDKAGTD